ncbi:MAG: hypothetical protein HQ582_13465, partial [Planctomycetes bacterium]|nr:hypothetical protein [Planctomycetota bacterium]
MQKRKNRLVGWPQAPCIAAALVWATATVAAESPPVLFVGDANNHVASGLRALEVPFRQVSEKGLERGDVCLFDHRVLIFGIDVRREGLGSIRDGLRAFVETGGGVLAFRSSGSDPWLPVTFEKDRAYTFGKVVETKHPVFTTPHALDDAALRAVHGGSIYTGFYALGEGWTPLLSAGKQQGWDKSPSQHAGDHYGIVELPLGRGRIVMCQMIPAYAWFHDSAGTTDCPGARLFENLVRYALGSAVGRDGPRKPRSRPDAYATSLGDVLRTPEGSDGLRMDDSQWRFTAKGPFTGACDRRGVYTISCGSAAAEPGNFGQVARRLMIPEGAERVMLRVYQSDDYCGGPEPKMVGDRRVSTSMNVKEEYRFRQVLIDDVVVTESDVLGRNIQPARDRIEWYDVTEAVRGKREATLALKVVDRQATGEEPFPTDCYFACVDLRTDFTRVDAKQLAADGYVETDEGMTLSGDRGSLALKAPVPGGRYVVAFRILDHPFGQGSAEVLIDGEAAASVRASADDFRFWWLTTPPVSINQGSQVALRATADGEERMVVSEVAFVPAELCRVDREAPAPAAPWAQSPVFKPGPPAVHERVTLTVAEPAGATRIGEVASQAVQFAFGALDSASHVAVKAGSAKVLPSQVRPFAYWPDGSIQAAVVTFPVDVEAGAGASYELHFGTDVASPDVPSPLTVEETAERFTIDTGRLRVEVPRKSGQVLSAVSVDGRAAALPNDAAWALELESEDGHVSLSDGQTAMSCVLAERGPLRAIVVKTGKLTDASGELVEYRYELHFTRGSADVRFFPRFSNVVHPSGVFIRRLSLKLPWQTTRASTHYASSEGSEPIRVETGGALDVYQHKHDTLSVAGESVAADAKLSRSPGRMLGWTVLDGEIPLKVGLRYAWQMYPKRIRVDAGLAIDLVAPPLTDEDVPEAAKEPPEVPDRTIGGVGYPQALGRAGLFRLSVGESVSHELWLSFGSRDRRPVEEQFAAGVSPLRAWADPAYVARTRVFCAFHPTDPAIFPRYEKAVDGAYD